MRDEEGEVILERFVVLLALSTPRHAQVPKPKDQ